MKLRTTTVHELQPMFLYKGETPYVCVLAPTWEGHWITAFHQFCLAAKEYEDERVQ